MLNPQQNLPQDRAASSSSSAHFSTSSHNLQTLRSHNNEHKEKKRKDFIPQPKSSNSTNNASAEMSSVNALMAGLQVNNDGPQKCSSTPLKKNAKKKQRKQLQLATGINSTPETSQSSQNPVEPALQAPVHNFIASPSNAAYSGTSSNNVQTAYSPNSRYYNNLSHHPQFQYMQNIRNSMEFQQAINTIAMQNSFHAASAPNTPQVQAHQVSGSTSIPCSPLLAHQTNMPFFQNMAQHPLLNHSLNRVPNFNANASTPNTKTTPSKNSPKHKKNSKNVDTKVPDDKKFEKYFSEAEVEKGLKDGTLFEGVLRINPKQFQYGFISSSDRDEQDIFIDGLKNRNRSLEGDVVVVQLIELKQSEESAPEVEPEKKQKRGKVVYIKEKVHNRTAIGHLKLMPDKNRQRALFVPRDNRIPRLNIPFFSWPNNFYQDAKQYEETLFLAKIMDWFDTRFALGKILSIIGQSGDMEAEAKAILVQNDLDVTPFGPEYKCFYPDLDYTIPEEEINRREDCRNMCIFSIDPSNCRDIDDAVSCRELDNGNYEVGVHISDVAHYLNENTLLDELVAQKATTIYLVERAYHMLPDELCMLCSLFPGVDKLAFSVFWEITKDAEVLSHRFSKTIIRSCAQLAYDHAQAILEDREDAETIFPETYNEFQFKDIQKTIKSIGSISEKFRKQRFDGGSLRIDQPKVSFKLSPTTGLPESYGIYEIKESHQLIEEFMLLANMTVAKRIYEDHPTLAFMRCHPPPSGYMLKNLAKSLEPMGIILNTSSAGDLHRSLLPYIGPDADMGKGMVLTMLCTKPMTRARYFCADNCEDDELRHYALNVPLYTHFTSPIRRYADIMVHRLLAASLNYRENPKWVVDKVHKIASQCNKQKYNAKRAGEMSSEVYMLKYIEMHSPVETNAIVVEVREKCIDVIIAAMGLNRRIFFNSDFPGEFNCVRHEGGCSKMTKMELTWQPENGKPEVKQVIETFCILNVHLCKDEESAKIETKLIRPN